MKTSANFTELTRNIKAWGQALGFQQVTIADTNLEEADTRLRDWLAKGYHGSMDYLQQHESLRRDPEKLVDGTVRVIMVRMDYLPDASPIKSILNNKDKAYISRYALGRDYHKLIRKRLETLAKRINTVIDTHRYRAFADSAPVFEKPLAAKSGLGWMGKHTLMLTRNAGSWFFLGALYTNLPLPIDAPTDNHCGSCTACLDICPTQAIVAPYQLDARRCISYLTIENKGSIPVELRPKMGNRIFGCDDCQVVCPWNKFAKHTVETDFKPRHNLDSKNLIELFQWDENTFLSKTEGSAIRRAGYLGWLRNVAVALGNANNTEQTRAALQQRIHHESDLVREHVRWSLDELSDSS